MKYQFCIIIIIIILNQIGIETRVAKLYFVKVSSNARNIILDVLFKGWWLKSIQPSSLQVRVQNCADNVLSCKVLESEENK